MNLDYDPTLSEGLVARLEEAARGVGLPLHRIELLGQDAVTAQGFVRSVRAGDVENYLDQVDFERLAALRGERVPDGETGCLSTSPVEA